MISTQFCAVIQEFLSSSNGSKSPCMQVIGHVGSLGTFQEYHQDGNYPKPADAGENREPLVTTCRCNPCEIAKFYSLISSEHTSPKTHVEVGQFRQNPPGRQALMSGHTRISGPLALLATRISTVAWPQQKGGQRCNASKLGKTMQQRSQLGQSCTSHGFLRGVYLKRNNHDWSAVLMWIGKYMELLRIDVESICCNFRITLSFFPEVLCWRNINLYQIFVTFRRMHRAKEKPHWATCQKILTDGMMLPCLEHSFAEGLTSCKDYGCNQEYVVISHKS